VLRIEPADEAPAVSPLRASILSPSHLAVLRAPLAFAPLALRGLASQALPSLPRIRVSSASSSGRVQP